MTKHETDAILQAIKLMADVSDMLPDEDERFSVLWRAVLALLEVLPREDIERADARLF
ncbi:MAG: hypothetical protein AB7T01_05115 [Acidithiobacillus sp.]